MLLPPSASGRSPWGRKKWACAATGAKRCQPLPGNFIFRLASFFAKFLFRLLFLNHLSFLFFSAPLSSLAQGHRALRDPQGPQPLLLVQARHHLVPATPLPPFRGAQQIRGVRPLHCQITARRRIFPSSRNTKTPAPATPAPEKKKLPGGRSLLLLPSSKRQLPRRNLPRRKAPRRVTLLALPLLHAPSSCLRLRLLAPSPPRPLLARRRLRLPGPLLPRRRPSPPSSSRGRRRPPAPLRAASSPWCCTSPRLPKAPA
jgi:hypothetical protein